MLSPDAIGFDPNLPEYAYNPAQAKSMLATAGVPHLSLTIDTGGSGKEISEAIASMFSRAGINAKARVWDTSVIVPIWRNSRSGPCRACHSLIRRSRVRRKLSENSGCRRRISSSKVTGRSPGVA